MEFVKKYVGERDAGIQCELCEKWFHSGCVKILEDIYKVLGKMTNLHWFCEQCNSGARKLLVNWMREFARSRWNRRSRKLTSPN